MRAPDIEGPMGKAWKVPLERAVDWVNHHPELMHQTARDSLFAEVWRDLWYVRSYVQEDLTMRAYWRAVILRDLRAAPPEIVRFYREAEWDVSIVECADRATPPLNGDGLFTFNDADPTALLFSYQFHGLSERQALRIGAPERPVTFAQYVVETMLLMGVDSDDSEWTHKFSKLVNGIREDGYGEPARRPLEVAGRAGLLIELEDGSSVSLPVEDMPSLEI